MCHLKLGKKKKLSHKITIFALFHETNAKYFLRKFQRNNDIAFSRFVLFYLNSNHTLAVTEE